jgi:hypothetical protein
MARRDLRFAVTEVRGSRKYCAADNESFEKRFCVFDTKLLQCF